MSILSMLSRYGISIPLPKWLISFAMILKCGVKGTSLGTRVIVFDANGAVFLVKHSYMKGWFFPGGGVDRWEVPVEAAKREVREEARMIVHGEPEFLGLFLNNKLAIPDYIACYVVRDWDWEGAGCPDQPSADGEIVEAGFFALDDLPVGTTKATRARLDELANGATPSHFW